MIGYFCFQWNSQGRIVTSEVGNDNREEQLYVVVAFRHRSETGEPAEVP